MLLKSNSVILIKSPKRKNLTLLLTIVLAASAVTSARLLLISSGSHERSQANKHSAATLPLQTQLATQPPAGPEAIGPVTSHVIAGGGGTSSGGSIKIEGTIGEVSASKQMSGGSMTLNDGFWNTLTATATPTASPTPSPSPTPTVSPTPTPSPTPSQCACVLQFDNGNYTVNEGAGFATITVTRTGDTSKTVSLDYATSDVGAEQRTDYTIGAGTLTFAPGETSKAFDVLVVDDLYVESNETLTLTLSNPTGGAILSSPSVATLTILDNDSTSPITNPLDNADARFFVRQHYYDFLSRLPDQGGFDFWASQITQCGSDQNCIRAKRVDVSNAFFYELEFQQTGSYVYRLYRAAFGNNQPFPNPDNSNLTEAKKLPSYPVFAADRARVVGGSSLAQGQSDFANAFVQRPAFLAKYPLSLDGPGFVAALLATIKNDMGPDLTSQSSALVNLFNSGGRGAVIYRLADDNTQTNPIDNHLFLDEEYNRAFVATQYFGYLRRDADIGGFLFWLGQVNSAPLRDTSKQHAMVCSFITAAEYQLRFSSVVTHGNGECPQ